MRNCADCDRWLPWMTLAEKPGDRRSEIHTPSDVVVSCCNVFRTLLPSKTYYIEIRSIIMLVSETHRWMIYSMFTLESIISIFTKGSRDWTEPQVGFRAGATAWPTWSRVSFYSIIIQEASNDAIQIKGCVLMEVVYNTGNGARLRLNRVSTRLKVVFAQCRWMHQWC